MIPAMVILGELSDIFGDPQRDVWLEIRLRLRASSKLFFTPFSRLNFDHLKDREPALIKD